MNLIVRTGRMRLVRRIVNLLAARLGELPFESLTDPRSGRVKRSMRQLLTMVIAGIAAGAKGLAEVENLSESLGDGARRLLKLPSRVPDTTLRDLLMRLDINDLRGLNEHLLARARRRGQLTQNLPLRVASLDGKHTATWLFDKPDAAVKYGQRQDGRAVVRTVTSCLVSAEGAPCLDAFPIPPETNEVGVFKAAAGALLATWGKHIDVIMYDAGGCSLSNASWLRTQGVDYVFVLGENQPELSLEARGCLVAPDVAPLGQEVRYETDCIVTRRIFLRELPEGPEVEGYLDWTHLRTFIRVETKREEKRTGRATIEDHFYLSSLEASRMSPEAWIATLRRRWAVENENHNIFDRILREDDRPFIMDPKGMLVVAMLRRITYNILTLFRSVTLRSEASRVTPWKELINAFRLALTVATVAMLSGVRRRELATG